MKGKVCVGLVLAVTATACLCRPAAEAPGAAGDPRRLPTSLVRRDWPEPLSQEQQHLISRFLPHMFAELRDRKGFVQGDEGAEALHDHFYPDWMDFGRRSSEDPADAS
ncbi:gastrin/cholecystokinin-like peptide [Anser cygnoides]|uniref:gastrin/cholecystokinin-like peptide n=1 Tax=Anser cygnoides TaxID=8845 RepID=UPI0034D161CC